MALDNGEFKKGGHVAKKKGFVIEIGADVQPLESALKDINASVKDATKELKEVDKLLKLDPKNAELAAQKQELLTKAISDTKEKLEVLKTAQEQAKDALVKGEIGAETYREIQREVIKAQEQLKAFEKQQVTVSEKFKQFGGDMQKAGEKITNSGKSMLPVSAAGAAVAGGLIGVAVEAGKKADDIKTMSKTYGIAVEDIQKFLYAQDLVDVSFDTIAGAQTKMIKTMDAARNKQTDYADKIEILSGELEALKEKQYQAAEAFEKGEISEKTYKQIQGEVEKTTKQLVELEEKAADSQAHIAYEKLGIATHSASGELRDSQEVFYEVLEALGNIENETERDALAMQIFGKSARELNPIIGEGAQQLKALGEEAEASGLILGQDALNGANAFNDGLDTMKAKFSANMMKMGASLAQSLLPAMEKFVDVISGIISWLGNLDPAVLQTIAVIAGLVAAVAPVVMIIGKLVTTIGAVISLAGTLGAALGGLGVAFGAIFSPINIIIIAVGALITIIMLLWNHCDGFRNAVVAVWEAVKTAFSVAIDFILKLVWAFVEAILGFFQGLWNDIVKIVTGLWGAVAAIFKVTVDLVCGVVSGFVELLLSLFQSLWDTVTGIVTALWETVSAVFSRGADSAVRLFSGMWETIKSAVSGAWNFLSGAFASLWDSIAGWFGNLASSAVSWGANMIGGFADGIGSMIGAVTDSVSGVIGAIGGFLGFNSPAKKGEGRNIVKWGSNMISGFLDGVYSMQPALDSALGSMLSAPALSGAGHNFNISQQNKLEIFGTIRAEGVNSRGETVAVVDQVLNRLRKEVRL